MDRSPGLRTEVGEHPGHQVRLVRRRPVGLHGEGQEDDLVRAGVHVQRIGRGAVVRECRRGRGDRRNAVFEGGSQDAVVDGNRADAVGHHVAADPVDGGCRFVVLRLRAIPVDVQVVMNERGGSCRLIQDVLTYSRVAREKIELSTVDVEQLVHQIIDERPDLQPPKVEILIQAPLPPVCGHEAYLSQCISNLLDNGVKFVPPGTQPRIRIRSETNDGLVRLWFEDNGVGIPKEAQERIFGLFQRMHTEKEFPGTGVGLTIVRKAVERMDGKVGVESEPGKGSRFWMQLRKEPKA